MHAHGHEVLASDYTVDELADALGRALAHARARADVLGDLPAIDGRLAADRWLFGEPGTGS